LPMPTQMQVKQNSGKRLAPTPQRVCYSHVAQQAVHYRPPWPNSISVEFTTQPITNDANTAPPLTFADRPHTRAHPTLISVQFTTPTPPTNDTLLGILAHRPTCYAQFHPMVKK